MNLPSDDSHGLRLVDQKLLAELKAEAARSEKRRSRLNLHPGASDPIQEMIIVFCADCLMPPHKNHQRSESLHVIEGVADVAVFDDSGGLTDLIAIGPWGNDRISIYRMQDDLWHTLIPRSEFVVVHEIILGPFESGGTVSAPWAPAVPAELRHFLDQALESHLR